MNKTVIIVLASLGGASLLGGIAYLSLTHPVRPATDHTDPAQITHTTGGSMDGYYQAYYGLTPISLEKFDVTVDTTYPFQQLQPGDDVIWNNRFQQTRTNHVVLKWNAEHTAFQTKGFGNAVADGTWIEEVDYIGKVIAVQTKDGMIPLGNPKQ